VTIGGGVARLWAVTTGRPLGRPEALPRGVTGASFSLDGKSIALWMEDKLQLCNAATGEPQGPPQAKNGWSSRGYLHFQPPRLDGTLSRRGLRSVVMNGVKPGAPELVTLSPAGGFILTHYEDFTGQLWNALTGELVGAFLPAPHG